MDGETFDALVKRLTQTRLSRVEALRGVLATVVVGLPSAFLATDADAKYTRKGAGKKRSARQGQEAGPRPAPEAPAAGTG